MEEQKFKILIEENGMIARLIVTDSEHANEIESEHVTKEIERLNIVHGLTAWQDENWQEQLASGQSIIIAKGTPSINGKDGEFIRKINVPTMVSADEKSR